MNPSKILLKNGIREMVSENEANFKTNIEQALALKLNNSIQEARESFANKILVKDGITPETNELKEFLDFIQNAGPGKIIFQDDSVININDLELEKIKNLFESLNPKNRIIMAQEILKNAKSFKEHIQFAEKVKGLQ